MPLVVHLKFSQMHMSTLSQSSTALLWAATCLSLSREDPSLLVYIIMPSPPLLPSNSFFGSRVGKS